jgi:hypothetical protein
MSIYLLESLIPLIDGSGWTMNSLRQIKMQQADIYLDLKGRELSLADRTTFSDTPSLFARQRVFPETC